MSAKKDPSPEGEVTATGASNTVTQDRPQYLPADPPKLRKVHSDSAMIKTGYIGGNSLTAKCRDIFEKRIENHAVDRLINPFSEFWGADKGDYLDKLENAKAVWKGADKRTKLTMVDDKYGRPVEGTLTEYRGNKARDFIANNIIQCCETIKMCGKEMSDGTYEVKFGVLFKTYERINDKLVGILVRARRHGLLDFPGEMLYQRQDDDVAIKLYKIPQFDEIQMKYINFKAGSEPPKDQPTAQ